MEQRTEWITQWHIEEMAKKTIEDIDVSTSKVIVGNLNAMHAARKQFIACESPEKLRYAPCHQVRAITAQTYKNGDDFYKCYGDILHDVTAWTLLDTINSDWLDKWVKPV